MIQLAQEEESAATQQTGCFLMQDLLDIILLILLVRPPLSLMVAELILRVNFITMLAALSPAEIVGKHEFLACVRC